MRRVHLFACSLVVGLTACGGGGGGGDGGSAGVGGSNPNPFPPQTPLVFGGVTTAATVSATNAAMIAANVIGASGTVGGSSLAGVSAQAEGPAMVGATGATGLTRRLASAIRPGDMSAAPGGAVSGAAMDRTQNCDSGTVRISGTVADNGTGTVSVAYNMCRTGNDTLNGPGSLKIDSFQNGLITDGTVSFTRINVSGPGINTDVTGSLRTQISGNTQTLTSNLVTQESGSGRQSRVENLVIVNRYDNVSQPTFYTQSINGRVYDGATGYVDVSTSTAPFTDPWGPLYYATSSQSFPDWGLIDLNGGTGSHVRITAIGADLAKIQVDGLANSARLRWSEFATALGTNLADSDGDGMHDSWESANGLNPSVNDAAADADADGYSNLTEYLTGSSAGTNGSVPEPVRHVWVTNVRDLGVDANGSIDVFVGASGSGIQLDPVTGEVVPTATFSGVAEPNGSGNRTVTDAQARTFTLAPTLNPTVWTITSSTGAVFTINNVAGTDAGSLIRYGDHGLAFRTVGTASPGYIYLVESRALVP